MIKPDKICELTLDALPLQEDISKLLRFESSALEAGQQTSLMEYASRMKAGTRNIYYLCAPNRHLAEHSPYYEAMKQKDMEVRRLNSNNSVSPACQSSPRLETICSAF